MRSSSWKIQVASPNGWADIKTQHGDGKYVMQAYASAEDAGRELDLLAGIDRETEYRIVHAATWSDDELYE